METIAQLIKPDLFVEKGEQVYEKFKENLEKEYKGMIVAIEIESEEYFLADTEHEAIKKARLKHPAKVFYIVRIGYPVVHIRR